MNRSHLLFTVTLSFLLFFFSDSQAQNIDVSLPDTLIQGNTNVLVPMTIDDLTGLDIISFEFIITYDSTVIQIDDVISSDFLADGFLVILNSNIPGRLSVAAAGTSPLEGEGTLLALSAKFLDQGTSNLVFEEFKMGSSNIRIRTQNGRIRNISLTSNEEEAPLISSAILKGNFPNPFNQGTNVVLELMETAEVGIQVYDIIGRLVHSIDKQVMQAGEQHIHFNLSAYPSGIYFYTVDITSQSGHRTLSNTMTFIR